MKTRPAMRAATAAVLLAVGLLPGCADSPDELMASARQYLARNEPNAAVIQLKNVLQKSPDLADARLLLGQTLFQMEEFVGAERELRKARELMRSDDRIVPLLARALERQGEYRKVIDEFSPIDLAAPASIAELRTTIGQAHHALGEPEAARVAFAAALLAVPKHEPALLGEARLKADAGDLPGALTMVEATLERSPSLTDGWQLKGDVLGAQGRADEALAAYRKALTTRVDSVSAHSRIVSLLIQQGKTVDAREQLVAMQKVAPQHPQTLYLKALLAFRERNYLAARDAIQQQLEAAPNNLPGLILGAQINFELGAHAQVQAALQGVLQRLPDQMFVRHLLIRSYLREGKPSRALDAIQPLIRAKRVHSDTLGLLGEIYLQQGDLAEASRYFDVAAKLDPKSTEKRTTAALVHFQKGEIGTGELEAVAAEDKGIRAELALYSVALRQRKFDRALAAVAAMERKLADKPLPHSLRASVLVAKGDLAGARRSLERALAVDPTYFPATADLARLDVLEKRPEVAKERFEAVLAKDPKHVEALLAIASLRTRAGASSDEVAALLRKAITANPTDPQPRLALIALYLRDLDPRKALAVAQEALEAMPDRAEILNALAVAFHATGDIHQAIAAYIRLAAVGPDSPAPYLRIADIHIAAKNYPAALESLRRALVVSPGLVDAQLTAAALDFSAGRPRDALASARALQKQNPAQAVGYIVEGDIHFRQGAWSEAVTAYRNGLKRAPTSELAIRLATALHADKGSSAEAQKFVASWLKDHPGDRAFRRYAAESAMLAKDYAGAARHYRVMVDADPKDAVAWNNLAWSLGQLKDPKALEYAQRALALAPNNPAFLDTLGVLLLDKGDVKGAVDSLQKATAGLPDATGVRLHLARALVQDGQKEAARKELNALAQLGDRFSGQAEVAKLMQGL